MNHSGYRENCITDHFMFFVIHNERIKLQLPSTVRAGGEQGWVSPNFNSQKQTFYVHLL